MGNINSTTFLPSKVLLILYRYTERLILYKPTLNDGSMNLVKVNTALNCIEQCQKWFLIA